MRDLVKRAIELWKIELARQDDAVALSVLGIQLFKENKKGTDADEIRQKIAGLVKEKLDQIVAENNLTFVFVEESKSKREFL